MEDLYSGYETKASVDREEPREYKTPETTSRGSSDCYQAYQGLGEVDELLPHREKLQRTVV
jgi:hypothetical protein